MPSSPPALSVRQAESSSPLPQLRVTTNGLSAVINASGEVIASTAMGERTVLVGEIRAQDPPPTLMVRWGDWVGPAGLLGLVASWIWRGGGSLGEYYTYGLRAWLTGLLIWWVSWAIGLMLFAAVLRVLIEAGCVIAQGASSARAAGVRHAMEWLGRLLFYAGVPTWLLLRITAG
jgi:hypothetical protein